VKSKAMVIDTGVFRYWDKWIADGKRPHVFAVDVATGHHKNLLAKTGRHLPPYEPTAHDYDVSPEGKELCFVSENVKEIGLDNNHDLYTLDLINVNATPKNITADNPAHDINPVYSPDGKYIAFLRQMTKFFYADRTRLMIHDRTDGRKTDPSGDFDRSCTSPHWLPDSKRLSVEVEDRGVVGIGFADRTKPGI